MRQCFNIFLFRITIFAFRKRMAYILTHSHAPFTPRHIHVSPPHSLPSVFLFFLSFFFSFFILPFVIFFLFISLSLFLSLFNIFISVSRSVEFEGNANAFIFGEGKSIFLFKFYDTHHQTSTSGLL